MGFAEELQKEMRKLRARRQELVDEIGTLDAELKDCSTALRVAQKLGAIPGEVKITAYPPTVSVHSAPSAQNVPKFKGHISKLALYLLQLAYPRGMTAGDIRQAAAEHHETEIKQTSLTVALGRFKASGELRLDGRTWYYVLASERRRPNDEPSNSADETEAPATTGAPEADDSGVAG